MKKNIFSLIIMLIAGIIVSVIGTIQEFEGSKFILTLLVTLIIFFVIGKIVEIYLKHAINNELINDEKSLKEIDDDEAITNDLSNEISLKTKKNVEKTKQQLENFPKNDTIK